MLLVLDGFYCKELMAICLQQLHIWKQIVDEVRHLDGIKGNFMISEIEYLAPATSYLETKLATLIIYSSVKEIVEHHNMCLKHFGTTDVC